MSDIMKPLRFKELMNWVLSEYDALGSIFGVSEIYRHEGGKSLPIFSEKLEVPFGPAAGPHTQLAQNIIAAYAGGSRFFELKTVQILDGEDLPVSKPCITAGDECYNCEWSTELYVPQAYEEYVKAWYAIKLLSRQLGLGSEDGFVFNMSVGYDLAGIKSEKIDKYIEGIKNAEDSPVWRECSAWAKANLARLDKLDAAYIDSISPRVSSSITLSTLHGCPPDEIERIATYLINEKGLNTYIKCNPTLLGYDFARATLDAMGYDYIVFDDHHFKEDLQFGDAIPMFGRLLQLAAKQKVEFGVKLTNTFPVTVAAGELPSEEMYMSGKSLYPLAIALAAKVEKEFGGKLRVSYSGGADIFNIGKIFAVGVWPITVATTLLKPGGYNRLKPMAEKLTSAPYKPFDGVDLPALEKLAAEARQDKHHIKPIKPLPARKIKEDVPLVDCFFAPCTKGCPIEQDIPTYIQLVGQGRYGEALEVILRKNPLPFITGTICSHRCTDKCTRNFYEETVRIRAEKLKAAEGGYADALKKLAPGAKRGEKVAIIGGGPAGMAAAWRLAKEGAEVTIFEKRGSLGGIVKHVIPAFRISDEAIAMDAAMLDKLGVEVRLNSPVEDVNALLGEGYSHVIIACGAWEEGRLDLEGGQAMNVLRFLEELKANPDGMALGSDVIVIGGGNTAMDAARAAKRVKGVEKVRIVYRRTKRYMPADEEELQLAVDDGIEFCELLAPLSYDGALLTCEVMKLGAADESGRRSPVATGERVQLKASAVISAIGEKVDAAFYEKNGVALDRKGRAHLDGNLCARERVYVIGDANRGPATVVEAIADAHTVCDNILGSSIDALAFTADAEELRARRGKLQQSGGAQSEASRCLGCSVVCENCVDVCPNRANLAIAVKGFDREQIVHVDKMCNECGNCEIFCPYSSAPYKDKFTLFSSEEDFADSQNPGFLPLDLAASRVKIRLQGKEFTDDLNQAGLNQAGECPEDVKALMRAVLADYAYAL